MVMVLLNPLRRWWQAAFGMQAGFVTSTGRATFEPRLPVSALRPSSSRPAARRSPSGQAFVQPLTPFRSRTGSSVQPARRAARRFWMTLDPQDQRHGAIGGSFAEVCAALETLAAIEERRD